MTEEKLTFQAEVSRLLEIVANSLYSNKEIFLRELVSNASDACDRLRYAAVTQADLLNEDADLKIALATDSKAKTLTVVDNGIGMSRDELVDNLGTIARSGTAAFVEQMEETKSDITQIGQFGVGFYSAFMVADQVEVTSRKAGEAEAWTWASDGRGEFTVSPAPAETARGTRIVLHLKKDQKEYLESGTLKEIIRTYSDHVAFPILLESDTAKTNGEESEGGGERLNSVGALWTRAKSEITDEQYKEFYHHVGHGFDDPWTRLHFKAEGVIEYTGLLFIPSTQPYDLFDPTRKHQVKLYVKRIFITDDCAELVPSYLRFLRGVIDSEDLPLNVSRELLQHDPRLTKIRKAVIKRVLGELKKKAEKAPEDYAKFWETFGAVLKEGLYEDTERQEALLPLARFRTTADDGWVSLSDYVARMKEGQDTIYYITGEDLATLKRSPQIEGFRAKGVEVLLMSDPVDEFWLPAVGSFEEKAFKSVTRGGADLGKIKSDDADAEEAKKDEPPAEGVEALIAFVKLTLKDEVKDVRNSERLTESPVCLVADDGDMDMHLERILRQHKQLNTTSQRILEVNPRHDLIKRMAAKVGEKGAAEDLEEVARLLLDQARILEGEHPDDPSAFNRRLSSLVAKGL